MKYTYEDIILDPDSKELKIGELYFFGNNPKRTTRRCKWRRRALRTKRSSEGSHSSLCTEKGDNLVHTLFYGYQIQRRKQHYLNVDSFRFVNWTR